MAQGMCQLRARVCRACAWNEDSGTCRRVEERCERVVERSRFHRPQIDRVSLKVLIPINWLINPRIFM